jgi:hypothetical protein
MIHTPANQRGRFQQFARKAAILVGLTLMLACNLIGSAPDASQPIISGPPVVRLSAPLPNATYLEKVGVNIQALISNAGADIDRVEVSVDNAMVASLPRPNAAGAPSFPITHTWQAAGVGAHNISVIAFRADGSSSSPAAVTINVVADASLQQPTASPSPTATQAAEPTDAPEPTEEEEQSEDVEGQGGGASAQEEEDPAEDEQPAEEDNGDGEGEENQDDNDEDENSGEPMATFNVGVNVRRGPGTNFDPPVSSYQQDQEAQILAINPAGDWYKIRGANGEGWVAASLITVSGDTSSIRVDAGPPTPVPFTPTPTPAPFTATPQSSVNLVIDGFDLEGYPDEIICGETFDVTVRVKNVGTTRSQGGLVGVKDTAVRDGGSGGQTEGAFGEIDPGETAEARMRLTVSTYTGEQHRIVATVDSKGQIAETNENDNTRELQYELQDGC